MKSLMNMDYWAELGRQAWAWMGAEVLTIGVLTQLSVLILIFLVSEILARWLRNSIAILGEQVPPIAKIDPYIRPLYRPVTALVMVSLGVIIGRVADMPIRVLDIASSLLMAWVIIRLVVNFIQNRSLARAFALFAWSIAALEISGLLEPVANGLRRASLDLGGASVSAYDVVWGVIAFVFLITLALFASGVAESRLNKVDGITPSGRVLIGKVIKIVLVALAFLLALNATGIDLTALAVFGGAVGVGLGFGLQKVVSNFISGMILLLDRSIKPGDVIEIQGTYGTINALAARYTSVITRDGTEYLIPNEDMITQPVINWSHSHTQVRRHIPISVSYKSDLDKAIELMTSAAREHNRVLGYPAPKTLLKGFADNGVDLELRMWINDPQNGVSNVASEVMLAIWAKFKEENIQFPFPQRVIHYADDKNRSRSDGAS